MKSIFKNAGLSNSSGQVVIEYVLLLVVAVSIAAILTKQLASRDPENPGVLVSKWHRLLNVIAEDLPDNDIQQNNKN